MGIHRGPNMEKGGLIFGYDSGHGVCDNHTSSRFYQGKPTTNTWNKNTHSYTSGNITATRNATPPVPPPLEVQGFEVYKLQSNDGGLNQGIMGTSNVVDGVGGNYVHSVYCFLESGTIVTVGQHWHPWAYGDTQNPPLGRWVRLSQTVTNAVDNYGNVANAYRTNGVAYFTAPQYELGSIVTPHVDGTRSSTESLIDLKRTTDIDLSNTSFDSTGQPTFDGTNDSVLIGNVGGYSNQMTCEAVFKTSSGASWKNMLCGATGDIIFTVNGSKLNFGSQGSNPIPHANYSTTNVNDGNLHHGIATYDGSQVKIYVDGVLESTNNRSGNQTPSSLRVGSNQTGSSEFFNGDLPLVKLYGRALSADEVQQNFNTYKNRFNI